MTKFRLRCGWRRSMSWALTRTMDDGRDQDDPGGLNAAVVNEEWTDRHHPHFFARLLRRADDGVAVGQRGQVIHRLEQALDHKGGILLRRARDVLVDGLQVG